MHQARDVGEAHITGLQFLVIQHADAARRTISWPSNVKFTSSMPRFSAHAPKALQRRARRR